MTRFRRWAAGLTALLLALVSVVVGPLSPATAADRDVPGQYIAKLYTESLGRIPYQTEWRAAAEQFSQGGCSAQTLAEVGQELYASADFARLGYDNTSRLLTLYRAVWNSEPEPAELGQLQAALDHGESWSSVVARFFVDERFTTLVPKICSGASDSSATSYALAGQEPAELPTASAGFSGTQAELQAILDESPEGSTVQLGQRALITLTEPLTVPEGVTLTTTGEPSTRQYAQMGRLVRGTGFNAPMINVAAGAKLTGVWVDGARNSPGNSAPDRVNVRVLGGTDTAVSGNKISNTQGAASIQVQGESSGYACSDVTVADNVITAYSNDHYLTRQLPDGSETGTWSDGITVDCGDTKVVGNQLVDTGGFAIRVRRATDTENADAVQHSKIVDNEILSAGVPMYGAIVADPEFFVAGQGREQSYSFDGTKIIDNRLWSGPTTHYVIGIAAGSRPWYAGEAITGAHSGYGLSISDNATGAIGARVRTGIAVSGMTGVEIGDDDAIWIQSGVPGQAGNPCPATDIAVSESADTGSADTDLDYSDVAFDGCVR